MLVYIIMLIKILIGFFICLIGYQLFLALLGRDNLYEGLENEEKTSKGEYKSYDDDPLILAKQNAGNIEVLNGRMDKIDGVKERVDTLQQSIDTMQTQIDGLVQQQADYAQDVMGTAPSMEGTEEYTADDVEAEAEEEEKPTGI
jgi:hypothetical protein